MISTILQFLSDLITNGIGKLFAINRDEEMGKLKEDNKTLEEQADALRKSCEARANPDAINSVRNRFQRDQ